MRSQWKASRHTAEAEAGQHRVIYLIVHVRPSTYRLCTLAWGPLPVETRVTGPANFRLGGQQ